MGKIKAYLMDISEEISTVITETSQLDLEYIADVDLEIVVDYAIKKYVSKLEDLKKAEFIEDNKTYIRDFVIANIKFER
jgi:hypothetical protein